MIGRLNHVAIVVPDLDRAASIYSEQLGASVSAPLDLPEHGVTTVFIELPNTKIELLHPLSDKSPIAKFLERGQDCFRIALRAKSFGREFQLLAKFEMIIDFAVIDDGEGRAFQVHWLTTARQIDDRKSAVTKCR